MAEKYYCEYCGTSASSINALTINSCSRHPSKGKHKLYEGGEKSKYTCKYCGTTATSINALTINSCSRHPDGANKGKHAPAL